MRPIALAGTTAIALALALPMGLNHAKEMPPPSHPALAPVVSVVAATRREIVQTAAISGTLVPRDEIMVTPEIDGVRIIDVLVEEGMHVERGQLLARLSHDLIDRQLAQQAAAIAKAKAAIPQAASGIGQAEAAVAEARASYQRAQQLAQSGNTTVAVLEARHSALQQAEGRLAFAHFGVEMAQAELAQAESVRDETKLKLARTEIRAPESGIINRRTARVGMTASSSAEPLFRLIARGEIELEGEVPEEVLPQLREGATAWIDLKPGLRLDGSVRAVYPEVDKSTRLGKVRIRLNPDEQLRIGAFARGGIEIRRASGVVLPQAALLYGPDRRASVLVVVGDRVEAREVRTGITDDSAIEVMQGVRSGEMVVARAGSFLRDGDAVRPTALAGPRRQVADVAAR